MFRFFRYQTPHNPIASSSQSRSKKFVYSGFLQLFFGMVERGSGRALTFRVPDRTRETLVTQLVQEFIQPGTVILSDKFSPYFNLNDIGYTHRMVNHSENFVDPYTGAHTNTIEGVWNADKKKLKRMCGTFKHQLPSYLDEFNWQRVYPGERFEMMLQHIAELYPVH